MPTLRTPTPATQRVFEGRAGSAFYWGRARASACLRESRARECVLQARKCRAGRLTVTASARSSCLRTPRSRARCTLARETRTHARGSRKLPRSRARPTNKGRPAVPRTLAAWRGRACGGSVWGLWPRSSSPLSSRRWPCGRGARPSVLGLSCAPQGAPCAPTVERSDSRTPQPAIIKRHAARAPRTLPPHARSRHATATRPAESGSAR